MQIADRVKFARSLPVRPLAGREGCHFGGYIVCALLAAHIYGPRFSGKIPLPLGSEKRALGFARVLLQSWVTLGSANLKLRKSRASDFAKFSVII